MDRAMANIESLPGGFNALRQVSAVQRWRGWACGWEALRVRALWLTRACWLSVLQAAPGPSLPSASEFKLACVPRLPDLPAHNKHVCDLPPPALTAALPAGAPQQRGRLGGRGRRRRRSRRQPFCCAVPAGGCRRRRGGSGAAAGGRAQRGAPAKPVGCAWQRRRCRRRGCRRRCRRRAGWPGRPGHGWHGPRSNPAGARHSRLGGGSMALTHLRARHSRPAACTPSSPLPQLTAVPAGRAAPAVRAVVQQLASNPEMAAAMEQMMADPAMQVGVRGRARQQAGRVGLGIALRGERLQLRRASPAAGARQHLVCARW